MKMSCILAGLALAPTIVGAILDGDAQQYFRGLKSCASQNVGTQHIYSVGCWGDSGTCNNIDNLCFLEKNQYFVTHDDMIFPYGSRSCYCTDGSECWPFILSSSTNSNKNGAYVNDCGTILGKYSRELVTSVAFNVLCFVASGALAAVCAVGLMSKPEYEEQNVEMPGVLGSLPDDTVPLPVQNSPADRM